MNNNDLLTGMANYTTASLDWCNQEAFDATQAVYELMNAFQSDAQQQSIEVPQHEQAHDSRVKLAKTLNSIAQSNHEVQVIMNPLLSTLQFQDAITQHAQGLTKMLHTWIDVRTTLAESDGTMTDLEFAEKLVTHTVSADEVDKIRAEVPELPDDSATLENEDDDCFLF